MSVDYRLTGRGWSETLHQTDRPLLVGSIQENCAWFPNISEVGPICINLPFQGEQGRLIIKHTSCCAMYLDNTPRFFNEGLGEKENRMKCQTLPKGISFAPSPGKRPVFR